jgi:hypothetical protein
VFVCGEVNAAAIAKVSSLGVRLIVTREALPNIAVTTIENTTQFENNQPIEKLAG